MDIQRSGIKARKDVQKSPEGCPKWDSGTELLQRSFSDGYKAEMVEPYRISCKLITQVGGDLGQTVSAVRRCVAKADAGR